MNDAGERPARASRLRSGILLLGALGVVFGDIGTSPIYALREAFHDGPPTSDVVVGVVSLVVWTLLVIVAVKYVTFVMRLEDSGEGGIVALAALATRGSKRSRRLVAALTGLGLFGMALLYGDGMITPAISVLAAVEGVAVLSPGHEGLVLPIAIAILVALFAAQRSGTGRIGAVFGPVMVVWFGWLGVTGLIQVIGEPAVFAALDPRNGIEHLLERGTAALPTLGAVFLAVTGSEALYADMGHFGRRPIARGWLFIAMPALVLQYLGQGALLIGDPSVSDEVFYAMVPRSLLPVAIAIATLATVIASQALVTGVFSLTTQAIQLGYLPRLRVVRTSQHEFGQVYVPFMNGVLLVAAVLLVVGFGSSGALASAYGVAVVLTMLITTVLFGVAAIDNLGWPAWAVLPGVTVLAVVGGVLGPANLGKIASGAWFPLAVGFGVLFLVRTWTRGAEVVAERSRQRPPDVDEFLRELGRQPVQRVPGTAVYLTRDLRTLPSSLIANLQRNHVLHEQVALVAVETLSRAHVLGVDRTTVTHHGEGFVGIHVRFGFAEEPDVPAALGNITDPAFGLEPLDTTWVVGRDNVVVEIGAGMPKWRETIYVLMLRNAARAADHYRLPPDRTIHVGRHVVI